MYIIYSHDTIIDNSIALLQVSAICADVMYASLIYSHVISITTKMYGPTQQNKWDRMKQDTRSFIKRRFLIQMSSTELFYDVLIITLKI